MHQETTVADTAPPEAVPPSFALFQMITGKFVSRAVYAAARLRLADQLAGGPRTAAELAASTGNHAPSLRRLLRALAGLGVVATVPGGEPRFALTPVGELLRDTPGSLRAMVLWICDPRHDRAWDEIFHSLATGEPGFDQAYGMPVFDHFARHPDFDPEDLTKREPRTIYRGVKRVRPERLGSCLGSERDYSPAPRGCQGSICEGLEPWRCRAQGILEQPRERPFATAIALFPWEKVFLPGQLVFCGKFVVFRRRSALQIRVGRL